jgi:hypothetical protein
MTQQIRLISVPLLPAPILTLGLGLLLRRARA